MSKPIVSPETIRELLDYDPDTGVMIWRKRAPELFGSEKAQKTWNSRFEGKAIGARHTHGYLKACVNYEQHYVHRLAFAHYHGRWPENEIDHINGIRTDNRIGNLREVTRVENLQNQKLGSLRSRPDGLLGAHWSKDRNKWVAHIMVEKKSYHLGVFDDKREAQAAYLRAKLKLHSGYVAE